MEQPSGAVCKRCEQALAEEGYQIPLCSSCRKEMTKFNFPIWLKISVVIILGLFIAALFRFPKNLMVAVHYERAKQADQDRRYVTAIKEYEKVIEDYDDTTDLLARLYMDYGRVGDYKEAEKVIEKIAGRESENTALIDTVNAFSQNLADYNYPDEELYELLTKMTEDVDKNIKDLEAYLSKKPNSIVAHYILSNLYFDKKEFVEAERLILNALKYTTKQFYPEGNLLLAAIYRETGNYDEAIKICNKALGYNKEDFHALASMARTYLKMKEDDRALELAKEAYSIRETEQYVISTLSLCYHYNEMFAERDKYLEEFKSLPDKDEYNLNLLEEIFSGKNNWR
jgi:tetratricopeptide (TPR) repeat protein